MRADLPTRLVRFAGHFEKLLLVVDQDAKVVRPSDVRLGNPRIPLRDRSVAEHLHGAHPHPLISQSGMDSRRKHLLYKRLADEAVNPYAEVAGRIRVLIRDEIFGLAGGVVDRRDSAAHDHLGDELDAFPPLRARGGVGNLRLKWIVRRFEHPSGQLAIGATLELASRRIGRLLIYVGDG